MTFFGVSSTNLLMIVDNFVGSQQFFHLFIQSNYTRYFLCDFSLDCHKGNIVNGCHNLFIDSYFFCDFFSRQSSVVVFYFFVETHSPDFLFFLVPFGHLFLDAVVLAFGVFLFRKYCSLSFKYFSTASAKSSFDCHPSVLG